jgi:hypothetical protein
MWVSYLCNCELHMVEHLNQYTGFDVNVDRRYAVSTRSNCTISDFVKEAIWRARFRRGV